MSMFKTEAIISNEVANTLYSMIFTAIEEEQNFPSKSDTWMNEMREALMAIGEATRIVIQD